MKRLSQGNYLKPSLCKSSYVVNFAQMMHQATESNTLVLSFPLPRLSLQLPLIILSLTHTYLCRLGAEFGFTWPVGSPGRAFVFKEVSGGVANCASCSFHGNGGKRLRGFMVIVVGVSGDNSFIVTINLLCMCGHHFMRVHVWFYFLLVCLFVFAMTG